MTAREERRRAAVFGALRKLYMVSEIRREYGVYAYDNGWSTRTKRFIKHVAGEELSRIKNGPPGCLPPRR